MKKSVFLLLLSLSTLNCFEGYDELYREALVLKNQGDYERSLEKLQKAAGKKETAEVFKEIANYYIEYSREYDKAEFNLKKSLTLDPNYPNSIHNTGLIFLKRYEQSLEKSPDTNLLNTAEIWFGKNIKLNPDFSLTYAEYGMVLFYKQKYGEALKNMDLAIEKGANKSYVHLLMGKVYYLGFKNYNRALDNFNIAYNDFSKDIYLLKTMALAHKQLNQIDNAHTYYRKYIKSLEDSGAPDAVLKKAKEEESSLTPG